MSKLDELRRTSIGNIDESMGGGRVTGRPIPGVSPPGPRAVPNKLQGVIRSGNAAEIPVEKIGPDPDQPREEFDEAALDRLAESLKTRGQLQPIRVRWDEGRGQYIIVCGERRWRAATRAGLATMTCIISEGPISPGELLALQCVENLLREDLSDMEQARAFRTLMEANGWSTHQLAKELGIVQPNVVRALALLKLPESIQEQVEQGVMKAATAYQLARIDDPAEQAEVAARVVAEGLSRDETVEAVQRIASKPRAGGAKGKGRSVAPGKPKLPTERTVKTSSGVKVVASARKGLDVLAWLEAIEEAASLVRAKLQPVEDQDAA
jgi:ParB family transcriptional regulator, chromosome partitioning protein